jgi:hypothetical protein
MIRRLAGLFFVHEDYLVFYFEFSRMQQARLVDSFEFIFSDEFLPASEQRARHPECEIAIFSHSSFLVVVSTTAEPCQCGESDSPILAGYLLLVLGGSHEGGKVLPVVLVAGTARIVANFRWFCEYAGDHHGNLPTLIFVPGYERRISLCCWMFFSFSFFLVCFYIPQSLYNGAS